MTPAQSEIILEEYAAMNSSGEEGAAMPTSPDGLAPGSGLSSKAAVPQESDLGARVKAEMKAVINRKP